MLILKKKLYVKNLKVLFAVNMCNKLTIDIEVEVVDFVGVMYCCSQAVSLHVGLICITNNIESVYGMLPLVVVLLIVATIL